MKTSRRNIALFGIAIGAIALLLAPLTWSFIVLGPIPSGVIHTEYVDVPFVWSGEMTWRGYAIVATLAMLGIALIVICYRFGFRRRAEPGASPNGGPTKPPANSGTEERPPLVS